MRSSLVATRGLKLVRSPSVRDEIARRRVAVVCAVVGVAMASGLVGYLTAPSGPTEPSTGPFSYFPAQ